MLASGYAEIPTYTAIGGVVEQEPLEWWRAAQTALAQVWQAAPPDATKQIVAVALSGQMQDLILLGQTGTLGRAILYSDTRAQAENDLLNATIGHAELLRLTGNDMGATDLLAKWLWLHPGPRSTSGHPHPPHGQP